MQAPPQRREQLFRRTLQAASGIVILLLVAASVQAENTSGGRWYVGGGLGAATGLDLCDAVTPGFVTNPGSCDESEFAAKVFGGYKFNKYVGLEGALVYLEVGS